MRPIVRGDKMESELFKRYHERFDHRGVETMSKLVRKAWVVSNLRKKLQHYKQSCETCLKNSAALRQSHGFLSRIGPVKDPFDVVSIDTKGGFTGYKSTRRYLHLAIDHATRYVWSTCAKGQGENDLINLLNEVLKSGRPKIVLCDRYGAMKGSKLKKAVEESGGKLVFICADSASSNGMVERVGFTLSEGIRCGLHDRNYDCAWTTVAKQSVETYNDTPHSVTGYAPRYLLTGENREFNLFERGEQGEENLEEARRKANEKSEKSHARNAFYFNKNRKETLLQVGQMVYCKLASKLNRGNYEVIYEGPYPVTRIVSGSLFEVEKEDGKRVVTNKKNLRLKIDRLEVD